MFVLFGELLKTKSHTVEKFIFSCKKTKLSEVLSFFRVKKTPNIN